MKKYNVYMMKNPDNTSILEYVDNINIVIPDMIDGKIDLVYVLEDFSLPSFIKNELISYNYSIPYEEMQKKLKRNTKNNIILGSLVWFPSKWKKIPFKVVSIKNNKATIVFFFKGKEFIREEVDLKFLVPIKGDFFVYGIPSIEQIYKQRVTSNNAIIIDGNYIKKEFGESFSTLNTINLILRLRIVYPEYQVVWAGWRNRMVESVFKNLLDLPIVDSMVLGKLYLTDNFYQSTKLTQDTLIFDRGIFTITEIKYSVVDFIKKRLWENKDKIFGLVITDRFINSININNYEEKLSKFPYGRKLLESIKNQNLSFIDLECGRNSPQEIMKKLEKAGWKWMVENYYYYFNIIFNIEKRRINASIR